MAIIQFGEYTPDLPSYLNTGSTVAKNVIPSGTSYQAFQGPAIYSSAIDAAAKGAFRARTSDGSTYNFVGNETKLYSLLAAAWNDVSDAGGYLTAGDDVWEFTQFGQDVIATNYGNTPQSFTMGTSSLFADLAGSPPKARHVATIRDFLVFGNTTDIDGVIPNRVRWSAIGDPTDWTPSSVTQSDFQNLDGAGGWVQKIVGGEYGIVFQERAVWRMTYVGSPSVFQVDQVELGRGALAPGSVVKTGNLIYYLGEDGFYVLDGQSSTPIGTNRVDKTFFNDLDASYLYNIYSCADPVSKIIYWSYPGSGNMGGKANKILMYNYSPNATKRWSIAEVDTECLFISAGEDSSLDDLDTISSSIDSLPFSLDARAYKGNTNILSGFDLSHRMVNFNGDPLDATIETGEFTLHENARSQVTLVRPVVDGSATVTVQMGTRDKLSDSVSYDSVTTLNNAGDAPVRTNARFHRARVNVSGDFNHAQGIEVVKYTKAGIR